MNEVLNREIGLGNFVLYDGQYYIIMSDTELFGLGGYIVKPSHRIYLLQNPLSQEHNIYKSIVNDYNNYLVQERINKENWEQQRKERLELKKTYVRGDVFKARYSYFLYLGLGEYQDVDGQIYNGHLYIKIYNYNDGSSIDDASSINQYLYIKSCYEYVNNVSILPKGLTPIKNDVMKVFKHVQNYEKDGHMSINTNRLLLNKNYISNGFVGTYTIEVKLL
jgi:hypothetical protein